MSKNQEAATSNHLRLSMIFAKEANSEEAGPQAQATSKISMTEKWSKCKYPSMIDKDIRK